LILLGIVVFYVPPQMGSIWFFATLAAPVILIAPMLVVIFRYARTLP